MPPIGCVQASLKRATWHVHHLLHRHRRVERESKGWSLDSTTGSVVVHLDVSSLLSLFDVLSRL